MSSLRVLHVTMSLDPVTGGGTVERTVQLSRALVKAGQRCTILTTDAGFSKNQPRSVEGVNVVAMPCLSDRFFVPFPWGRQIREAVSEADVIHLVNHWTMINVLTCREARRQRKPYVVCPCGALPIVGRSALVKRVFNRLAGKRMILRAQAQIAITADEALHFAAYGVDPRRVIVIPNGVDERDFIDDRSDEFRRKYALGSSPIVAFMGRLNRIKGPDLLLEAFANLKERCPRHQLVFMGPDSGSLAELRERAVQRGVAERVHFLGYVGGADKSRAYHAADVLVIPSRQEAMSIVVLEAGAAGTPVIMTDQCGFPGLDEIGAGRTVAADVTGIQQALIELLAPDAPLVDMGQRLKRFIKDRYTWDAAAAQYLSMFQGILAAGPCAKEHYGHGG